MADNNYSFLFGNYFLAFAGFMKTFKSFKKDIVDQYGNEEDEPLRVLMGAPEAAFRNYVIGENTNGVPSLPVLNFTVTDFKRNLSMENPFVRVALKGSVYSTEKDGVFYTPVTSSPQIWDLTFQCSLWTAGAIERDDMVSKIMLAFRGGQMSLPWFPDEMNNPENLIWITYKTEEGFTDATEYEGLSEKSLRDFIRTDFNISTQAMLPYATILVPAIKSIQVNKEIASISNGFYRLDVVSPPGSDPLQTIINNASL